MSALQMAFLTHSKCSDIRATAFALFTKNQPRWEVKYLGEDERVQLKN